ncbi:MAG TPA: hypothetical protein VGD08_17275 [Stellaceae bacterium]
MFTFDEVGLKAVDILAHACEQEFGADASTPRALRLLARQPNLRAYRRIATAFNRLPIDARRRVADRAEAEARRVWRPRRELDLRLPGLLRTLSDRGVRNVAAAAVAGGGGTRA